MTQSEVPRRMNPGQGRELRAAALSIGAFERGTLAFAADAAPMDL
jgi:hypothetical protein